MKVFIRAHLLLMLSRTNLSECGSELSVKWYCVRYDWQLCYRLIAFEGDVLLQFREWVDETKVHMNGTKSNTNSLGLFRSRVDHSHWELGMTWRLR